MELPTFLGTTIRIPRGWVGPDLTVGDRTVRVVNTHLERFDPAIQIAQPAELLGGPATPLRVVILGDLNSAPSGNLHTKAVH